MMRTGGRAQSQLEGLPQGSHGSNLDILSINVINEGSRS